MTPISRSEPLAGNRHFSSSWPALSRPMAVSPRLWRVPRTSRLYIGQSFASPSARHVDGKHGTCKDDEGQHRTKSGTRHDSLHARAFAQSTPRHDRRETRRPIGPRKNVSEKLRSTVPLIATIRGCLRTHEPGLATRRNSDRPRSVDLGRRFRPPPRPDSLFSRFSFLASRLAVRPVRPSSCGARSPRSHVTKPGEFGSAPDIFQGKPGKLDSASALGVTSRNRSCFQVWSATRPPLVPAIPVRMQPASGRAAIGATGRGLAVAGRRGGRCRRR